LAIVRLDLGEGPKRPESLRLEPCRAPATDVLADLGAGLPLADSVVDELYADHALAHVEDFVGAMEEVWRVRRGPGPRSTAARHLGMGCRGSRHQRLYTIETFECFDPRRRNERCPTVASYVTEESRLYLTARGAPRGSRPGARHGLAALRGRQPEPGMQYRWERWLGHLVGFERCTCCSVVKERRLSPRLAPSAVGTEEAS
jgi:hypothetical protein